jgi:hypothetical protein
LLKSTHKLTLKLWFTKWFIHFKKVRYVEYSSAEIEAIIKPHLPQTVPISVPRGEGKLVLLSAEVDMPKASDQLLCQLLCSFEINYLASPIYRAHLLVSLTAKPDYKQQQQAVYLAETRIVNIRLVKDEYSIIKDYKSLLTLFIPSPMLSLLTGTMKNAFNLMSSTVPVEMNDYLKLYVDGSKQRVLDYHQSQLEKRVAEMTQNESLRYNMDGNIWEEWVFINLGKEVVVEEGKLRFKLKS